MAAVSRRLAAVLFTDLEGYTALTQEDEAASLRLVEEQEELLRPLVSARGGRRIKSLGDGLMLEFPNARDAVDCAVELQRSAHERNLREGPPPLRIRVGIHLGDVEQRGDDIFGDAVNIASRVVPLAEAGGVCFSAQVFDQVHNKIPYRTERLGLRTLKGVREPVALYRLVLPWGARPSASEPPAPARLAVLPFANISPDPKDAYFAEGLTEELISVLSQIRGLRVIARTSVARYKDSVAPITQIGSELAVASVVEGSVRKAGERLRVSVQLVDARTEEHRWAQTFDRSLDDVFAIQTEIAERTASVLRTEIARPGAIEGRANPTSDLVAYDLYLRGLVAMNQVTREGYEKAFRYFADATDRDPGFAEAFAAWATGLVSAAGDHLPMRQVMPRARELAQRALELDPESSSGHAALANIAFQFDHDWTLAEAEFRRALELNPSDVVAHRFYGFMLKSIGRWDEARQQYRRVMQLDPAGTATAPGPNDMLAWIDLESGNYDAAVAAAERNLAQRPRSVGAHVWLGLAYWTVGRRADAAREADAPTAGATEDERFDHALLAALVGRPKEARRMIDRIETGHAETYTSATHLAMLYAALGEKDRALDLLENDLREGDPVLWMWYRGAYFDPLRDDPRFGALLREYGLPEGTSAGGDGRSVKTRA